MLSTLLQRQRTRLHAKVSRYLLATTCLFVCLCDSALHFIHAVSFMTALSLWHIWKFSFESRFRKTTSRCGYTLPQVFTCKSQLSESFLFLHAVSCDWPVTNTWRYWPEFHGCNTVRDNWK